MHEVLAGAQNQVDSSRTLDVSSCKAHRTIMSTNLCFHFALRHLHVNLFYYLCCRGL